MYITSYNNQENVTIKSKFRCQKMIGVAKVVLPLSTVRYYCHLIDHTDCVFDVLLWFFTMDIFFRNRLLKIENKKFGLRKRNTYNLIQLQNFKFLTLKPTTYSTFIKGFWITSGHGQLVSLCHRKKIFLQACFIQLINVKHLFSQGHLVMSPIMAWNSALLLYFERFQKSNDFLNPRHQQHNTKLDSQRCDTWIQWHIT